MKTEPATPEKIAEFRRELKSLILKYSPTLAINTGYYGDVDGIDFCLGDKRVVEVTDYGAWDFVGDGTHLSFEQLRREGGESP